MKVILLVLCLVVLTKTRPPLFGYGNLMIILKKNNQTYDFTVRDTNVTVQIPQQPQTYKATYEYPNPGNISFSGSLMMNRMFVTGITMEWPQAMRNVSYYTEYGWNTYKPEVLLFSQNNTMLLVVRKKGVNYSQSTTLSPERPILESRPVLGSSQSPASQAIIQALKSTQLPAGQYDGVLFLNNYRFKATLSSSPARITVRQCGNTQYWDQNITSLSLITLKGKNQYAAQCFSYPNGLALLDAFSQVGRFTLIKGSPQIVLSDTKNNPLVALLKK